MSGPEGALKRPASPEHEDQPVSRRTELLRAAADGELTVEDERQLAALLRMHPEDASIVEFERGLRRTIAGSWHFDPVPAELERRVRSLSRVPITPARPPRRLLLWGAALAAAALIALAVFLGPGPARPWTDDSARLRLVSFLTEHHRECEIHADRAAREFTVSRLDAVPAAFAGILGARPDVGGLGSAGLTFRGAGKCGVPGRAPSVHLVLGGPPGTQQEGQVASLFIQRDTGTLPLADGVAYALAPKHQSAEAARHIILWRRDGLLYFLVSGQPSIADAVRLAMQVPQPSERL